MNTTYQQDSASKFQTKIDFLQKENSTLRNESMSFQKLIKLMHSKQATLDEITLPKCEMKPHYSCKDIEKTNSVLVQLFQKTMEENMRLVALISSIQHEKDLALSKSLIHEQILEGLESEGIGIIVSLNGQIQELKQKEYYSTLEIDRLQNQLKKIPQSKDKSQISSLDDDTKQKEDEKKITIKIIQLNNLLEESLEQLNQKKENIKLVEEQKNELIIINSLLMAEIKQLKSSNQDQVSLTTIIAEQQKIFNQDESNGSFSSISSAHDVTEKVILKKKVRGTKKDLANNTNYYDFNNKSQEKFESSSFQFPNHNTSISNDIGETHYQQKTRNKDQKQKTQPRQSQFLDKEKLNIQIQRGKTMPVSQQNIGANQNGQSNLIIQSILFPNHLGCFSPSKTTTQNIQAYQPILSEDNSHHGLIVPKLDLTKALKVQQNNFKNQQKQEQHKHQLYMQQKIGEKQKMLEKKRQEKGLTDEQLSQLQQQILQLEEQKIDKVAMLVEENSHLQEEIKKARASIEQNYFLISQQERQIDQLKRDLEEAVSTNSTLIQSVQQYEKKWMKISPSFFFLMEFYQNYCPKSLTDLVIQKYSNNTKLVQHQNLISNQQNFSIQGTSYCGHSGFNTQAQLNVAPTSASRYQINSAKSNRFLQFHSYLYQFDQMGQKAIEESDVDQTVFIPLSLRNNSEKKYSKIIPDQEIIDQVCVDDCKTKSDTKFPLLRDLSDNFGIIPLKKREIMNMQEAKSLLLNLAQDLFLNKNLNKQIMYMHQKNIQDILPKLTSPSNLLQKNNQLGLRKRAKSLSNLSSDAQKNNSQKFLPFKCYLKSKNVQQLRTFSTKTMTMKNNPQQLSNNLLNPQFSIAKSH